MYGISQSERSALNRLREQLHASRTGERWERQAVSHYPEINALMAVHPPLRQAVCLALVHVEQSHQANERLDAATIAQLTAALDALHREGSFELRRWASDLREEVAHARGRTLSDLLSPPHAAVPARRGTASILRTPAYGVAIRPRRASSAEGMARLPERSTATTT